MKLPFVAPQVYIYCEPLEGALSNIDPIGHEGIVYNVLDLEFLEDFSL